ncbi:hypothetical protein BDR22DRAFT_887793 [Usnea florida]
MPSSQPMSIASILGPNISGYSPSLRYMSSRDPDATQAAQVPSPEANPPSLVEDPAFPDPDAESVSAAVVLQAMSREYVEHNVCEDSPAVTESDPSACNAAESLLQLRAEVDTIFLKTSTEQCECDDYHEKNITFCEHDNCLGDVSPPDVVRPVFYHAEDHPSDEDPLPSAVPEHAVKLCCHDHELSLHARLGNALFAVPLDRQDESSSFPCRRCQRLEDVSQNSWYAERYRMLGCNNFEGEDTVSLDDDSEDSTQHGQHDAADDPTEPRDPAMWSPSPRLLLKIKKLALKNPTWSASPSPSSSATSASDTDDAAVDPPLSSTNTTISPASPPSAHDPRPKNGITTSPLKQVENASASPSERDPPPSAKAKGKRPLYMLRDRSNLRLTSSKGRDLANVISSNGVPESLSLPAGAKEGKDVAVTDAATSRPRTRAQGLRGMVREGVSMDWTPTPTGEMIRLAPDALKMRSALERAKKKEAGEKVRQRKEAWGMNGGWVSIFPRGA